MKRLILLALLMGCTSNPSRMDAGVSVDVTSDVAPPDVTERDSCVEFPCHYEAGVPDAFDLGVSDELVDVVLDMAAPDLGVDAPDPCGDGECSGDEGCSPFAPIQCPEDCGTCFCGDFSCNQWETQQNCPEDCGLPSCGDGVCDQDAGESCGNCSPGDGCPHFQCAADCGTCCNPTLPGVGSGCNWWETSATCPQDCGSACGDGVCEDALWGCWIEGDNGCYADCGICGCSPIPGTEGCRDCACEDCVCALEPECCGGGAGGTWDDSCAALCDDCGGCEPPG